MHISSRKSIMKIKPFRNNVLFKFLDETAGAKGVFHAKLASSGIILPPTVSLQKQHRWGRVYAAGPDAAVKEGDLILIEALMWMEGVKHENEKIWKTDDTKILAVADSIDDCQPQF